ncbi:MAG: metallophosphoesterase family protein [Aggregatilineales bacterium]
MTRLAILSDIHGNLPALDAVLEDMRPFEVDHIVVAGDSINWGPFSLEVMYRLHEINASVMRGNHELYLLDIDTPRMPAGWDGFTMPRLLAENLPADVLNRISCLPDTLQLRFRDAPSVRVVHGTPNNHWQGIYHDSTDDEIRGWLAGVAERVVIAGHTHLRLRRRVDDWLIINPGSVGMTFDRNPATSYVILEGNAQGWKVNFRRVPYDQQALFDAYLAKGYSEKMPLEARLMLADFERGFPHVYAFNIWKAQHHPNEATSDALIDAFFALDNKDDYVKPIYRVENLQDVE